jgi:ParB/RepB/Spo0J family partition protein
MQDQPNPDTITHVPVAAIDIGDQDLRELMMDDAIIELAADIAARGLLQPIGVHQVDAEHYQLRWGKRRLLAHRHLRLPTIPAKIITGKDAEMIDDAIAENLHRRDLTLDEECHAVTRMHEQGLSPDQISTRLSKGRAWILRRLAIPNLPEELRRPVLTGQIPIGVADALALLEDPTGRAVLLQQCLSCNLTTAQVRQAVDSWKRGLEQQADPSNPTTQDPNTPTPGRFLTACALCGTVAPDETFRLIRVCGAGCSQQTQPMVETTPYPTAIAPNPTPHIDKDRSTDRC